MTDRSGRGSGDARRAARLARPHSDGPDSSDDAGPHGLADFRRRLVPPDPHQPLRARWDPTTPDGGGPRQPRPNRKQLSRIGRFVSTYGWRAYALPVLTVVTLIVLVDAVRDPRPGPVPARSSGSAQATAGEAPGFGELSDHAGSGVIGAPQAGANIAALAGGALPDGGRFTAAGRGSWHAVRGATGQIGPAGARVFTYTVEVEDGLDTAGFGGDQAFAEMVDQTLADPKSWTADQRFAFRRIDQGAPAFRISLTSQQTTRRVCGFAIPIDTSCFNQGIGRVVLDEARWVRGALAFQGDLGSYRQYMVNHEVGHAIGYHQHLPCQTDGGLAPVMMQQTFGTADNDVARLDPAGVVPMDGKVCHFNPWPYPRA